MTRDEAIATCQALMGQYGIEAAALQPAPASIVVHNANNTYAAKSQGVVATCTAGYEAAAQRLLDRYWPTARLGNSRQLALGAREFEVINQA